MTAPTTASIPDVAAAQRHTVRTLVVTQALGGIGVSSAIAVAALLARDITGSDGLSGLASTGLTVGAALASAALASVMARRGRRPGLALGYLVGALGAGLAIVAGVLRSFPLLVIGVVLIGAVTAANNQSRYAATDLATPARRGRDLSTVVWATTIGSVLGPNLGGPGAALAGWLHLPERTGPFLFTMAAMVVTAAVMVVRLRPDPLLLARATSSAADPTDAAAGAPERPWRVIRRRPLVLASLLGMAFGYCVMVSVMAMTPLHMDHGGAGLELIGLVISVHILGMYAFSPLVGELVDRIGNPRVLGIGGLLLLVSLVLTGLSTPGASWGLGAGLFLLGLGWSFATVSASTLLVASTPVRERPRVQGTVDMVVGLVAAAGGAGGGLVVATAGYAWLSAGAAVFAFAVVLVSVYAARRPAQTDEPADALVSSAD